ncbi:mRNA-capping enzyme-like, partial [Galendromus occidentalis]|uniref:mRNA-capping enzyme-like n=1 Tax=Galendromus occidentalis TaxID=34638 RepID=A0AAJ7SIF2_9ACAR
MSASLLEELTTAQNEVGRWALGIPYSAVATPFVDGELGWSPFIAREAQKRHLYPESPPLIMISAFQVGKKGWDSEAATTAVRKAREPGICERNCIDSCFAPLGSVDGLDATDVLPRLPELYGTPHSRLSRETSPKLSEATYKVTWKSEGIRCLLLITNPGVAYLLDERNEAHRVSGLTFPYSVNTSKQIFTTRLDGELVFDQDAGRLETLFTTLFDGKLVFDLDGGICRPCYLIHDIIHFRLLKMWKMDFSEREWCIQRDPQSANRAESALQNSLLETDQLA